MRLATEKAGIKKKRQLIESQKSQRLSEQAKELKDEIEAVLKPKTAKESTTHSEAPAADVEGVAVSTSITEDIEGEDGTSIHEEVHEDIEEEGTIQTRAEHDYSGDFDEFTADTTSYHDAQENVADHQSNATTQQDESEDSSLDILVQKLQELKNANESDRIQRKEQKLKVVKEIAKELIEQRKERLSQERKIKDEIKSLTLVLDKALHDEIEVTEDAQPQDTLLDRGRVDVSSREPTDVDVTQEAVAISEPEASFEDEPKIAALEQAFIEGEESVSELEQVSPPKEKNDDSDIQLQHSALVPIDPDVSPSVTKNESEIDEEIVEELSEHLVEELQDVMSVPEPEPEAQNEIGVDKVTEPPLVQTGMPINSNYALIHYV
jgi:hypothetical protein